MTMAANLLPPGEDPIRPAPRMPITVVVDDRACAGESGQTLAGVLLANGIQPRRAAASGMFCGIGVCFGCTATVDGIPDVRTCQRPAVDGTVVTTDSVDRDG